MATSPKDISHFLEPAKGCVCFNIRKSARAITQLYEEALRPTGLRATQFTLLVATRVMGAVTITELAKALVMDRTTLTRSLRPLEVQGLVRILPGKADRREREVTLTTAGQETLATALPLWETVQTQVTRELGQGRVTRLLTDLAATVRVAQAG
ncbi:MAG: MarR family winged helix-turn-helix transcriptional regulator [Nitrospirota bacterium]|jgi:DNA-binding MarR family transcriptional regulator|nr:MarR family winged helix-turn-helix transcriptional regulator [Nitrospirota bacterium]